MKAEVGDYVKMEIGKGNFFKGFVTVLGENRIMILIDKTKHEHTFQYFDLREIYQKDEYPEYYL